MHIAIDDTYGPERHMPSRYVTGDLRTALAVVFSDDEVDEYRAQLTTCLEATTSPSGKTPREFHWTDVYNRRPPWDELPDGANLGIVSAFAEIYRTYRWPIHIQTVDDRTLLDHQVARIEGEIDGLCLSDRSQLALVLLLIKLKTRYDDPHNPVTLLVDEGFDAAGAPIGEAVFREWGPRFQGRYASSQDEPLLQIADFLAFMLNRSQYLMSSGKKLTEVDHWFLGVWSDMAIDCADVSVTDLRLDSAVEDLDAGHDADRRRKDLPDL